MPPKRNLVVVALGTLLLLQCITGNAAAQQSPPRKEQDQSTAVENPAKKEEVDAAQERKLAEQRKAQDAAFARTKAGKVCKKHPNWSRPVCEDVAAYIVRIGMTREQALEAWTGGWLRIGPRLVNRTVTANGVYEQWVRSEPGSAPYSQIHNYLYFTNGILTSYQLGR